MQGFWLEIFFNTNLSARWGGFYAWGISEGSGNDFFEKSLHKGGGNGVFYVQQLFSLLYTLFYTKICIILRTGGKNYLFDNIKYEVWGSRKNVVGERKLFFGNPTPAPGECGKIPSPTRGCTPSSVSKGMIRKYVRAGWCIFFESRKKIFDPLPPHQNILTIP